MLTKEQIQEIREHLENSKNPVFFFDNDPDGLCSFILLQRYIGRGRGIAIKSNPGLELSYFKRVEELKADYIFVLDKPLIDTYFIEKAKQANIPLVHIDHHNVPVTPIPFYYSTFHTSGKNEPTSYLCYKVSEKKEDAWIAAIGCITDAYLPDFIDEIKNKYPDLLNYPYKTAFDIQYNTQLGKMGMILSFGIKDKTSNVVLLMKFMMKVNNPWDLLEETAKTKQILHRFNEINEKYEKILEKARKSIEGDILFFTYSGDMSLSQYISNKLMYEFPKVVIIAVYTKGNIANVSLRWNKDIRTPTVNTVKEIEGATGGGHENSCGARIPADKLDFFKEKLLEEIKKIK